MWLDQILKNTFNISSHSNVLKTSLIKNEDILNIPSSIINSDIQLEGTLMGDGSIELGGNIVGNIEANCLTIRDGASVTGNIYSNYVLIHGKFKGTLKSNNVIISSTGEVEGEIFFNQLVVDLGASINATLKKSSNILYETDNKKMSEKTNNKSKSSNKTTKEEVKI